MSTRKNLRLGLIGCGLMGDIHAKCFTDHPHCELVACYNPTRAKAEKLAGRYGGEVMPSVEALLAAELDAVIIASPQAHHCEQILAATRAGRHIFCEKPVALTSVELRRVQREVEATGLVFMTGHQMRLHPVIETVRKHLKKLEPVFHLDLEWCFRLEGAGGRCWENYRLGGFCMELGCHAADLACYLLGEPVHVSGHTLRLNHERVTEDHTCATVQFASNAVARLLVSANFRTRRQGLLTARIIGEKGRIEFSCYPYSRALNRAELILDHGKKVFVPDTTRRELDIPERPSLTKVYPGFFDVYQRQAKAFYDAVTKGTAPPCGLVDGCRAVELVLASYHQQGEATRKQNFRHPRKTYRSDGTCHPPLNPPA